VEVAQTEEGGEELEQRGQREGWEPDYGGFRWETGKMHDLGCLGERSDSSRGWWKFTVVRLKKGQTPLEK